MSDEDFDDIDGLYEAAEEGEKNGQLYEHFRFEVDKGQGMLRIDKFLQSKIENASRTKIQAAADANCILVNGVPVKSNYRVKPDDVIQIMMTHPPREIEIVAPNQPLLTWRRSLRILFRKVLRTSGSCAHCGYLAG